MKSSIYRILAVLTILLIFLNVQAVIKAQTSKGDQSSAKSSSMLPNMPMQSAGTGLPDDSNIEYIGRWDTVDSPYVIRSYWAGAALRVNFTGSTSVGIQLGGSVIFFAQIDNGIPVLYNNVNGSVTLATGLDSSTPHQLKVTTRNEGDILRFQKLLLDVGGVTTPRSTQRSIVEFVGDSITAGKGSSSGAITSYAKFTTDLLNADFTTIAYTGICLVDGAMCGWTTGMSQQFFKTQTVAYGTGTDWDFSRYQASAVVVNLGTNDDYYGVTDTDFQNTYIAFLQNIRVKYPNAHLFALRTFNSLKVGPTQAAVAARNAAGDLAVHYVDTTGWVGAGDYVDTYHLNDGGNQKVAQHLASILQPYVPGALPFGTTTITDTPTSTPTNTVTNTPTTTPTSMGTNTPTNTPTPTKTATLTATFTPTYTPTNTPTSTVTNTVTNTPTSTPTYTPTQNTNSTFKIQYMAGNRVDSTSDLAPYFKIVNTTGSSVPLYAFKIRYWFTRDTQRTVIVTCTAATVGCGNLYGSFNLTNVSVPDADSYLEIGFRGAAGSIAANGNSGEIRMNAHKNDYSNFMQSNDYSFDGSLTTYGDTPHVTLYYNGSLVWGVEPAGWNNTPTMQPPTNTPTPGNLKAQYATGNTALTTDTLKPLFNVVNTTVNSVPLSELKLRYWFTRDTAKPVTAKCIWAAINCANVTVSYTLLATPKQNADSYLEVGFTTGNLNAGSSTGELQFTANKSDWSNFTQSNDYSFDATKTSFADAVTVTLYRNNVLVWGVEPADTVGGQPMSPTPSATLSSTPIATASATPSPTFTATPMTATLTETPAITSTVAPTLGLTETMTATFTPTQTNTPAPTNTPIPSHTPMPTATLTFTPTLTATWTSTETPTETPTYTPTFTPSPTYTETWTATPTETATQQPPTATLP